jgi:signal transduction protein with GAF and PtsI domain
MRHRMADHDSNEMLTEEIHLASSAKTQKLPRLDDQTCEDFQAGQARVLQMIAANKPLGEVLSSLVKLIEAQSPDMLCSVLLLSDDGNHVRHGAAPSLPDDYVKAIDGSAIGPKQGSCGTAMYRGEPVVVSDIMTDPLWEDFRDLAAAADLRACWSTPILSGRGKVLGSFAMYYREPRTPTGDESRLTDVATRIAGLAIERQAAHEALARTQNQLVEAETIGEVAASIVDEIEEPLTAIVKNAEKSLELLGEESELREVLTTIAHDGRRSLQTIGRMRASLNKLG